MLCSISHIYRILYISYILIKLGGKSFEKFGAIFDAIIKLLSYFPSFRMPLFSSVAQSCPTVCDPVDCSAPGFPVHHQLLELTQTHVHQVSDAIQHLILCHPLSSCLQSFPASGSFSVSQFFTLGGQSIGVSVSASVLPMNI